MTATYPDPGDPHIPLGSYTGSMLYIEKLLTDRLLTDRLRSDRNRKPICTSAKRVKARFSLATEKLGNRYSAEGQNRLMRVHYQVAMILLLCSLTSIGQQQPAPGKDMNASSGSSLVSGVVNGRVYLGDTKAPARNAEVYLQPVESLLVDGPPGHGKGQDQGITISVETSFDGRYSFPHVPFGSYYVVAVDPGYISPYVSLSLAEGRSSSEAPPGTQQKAARERVLRSLPRVDVQSSLPVDIDVVLERGAAISGTIAYDDGTPASGVQVSAMVRSSEAEKESWVPVEMASNQLGLGVACDDRGNYRISGLSAGRYIVMASLNAMRSIRYISSTGSSGMGSNGSASSLNIYSGCTPRMKDASSFSLALGEERSAEDIRIPLSKLHTISGNFVSAQDGHVVNSGGAVLLNADDNSFVATASTTEDNPGVVFYFVYEGDYILSSSMSADVDYVPISQPHSDVPMPPQYEGKPRHFYGSASKPLHVEGDMEGVTIEVPEPTAKEAQMFKSMQEQEQQNRSGAPK